MQVEHDARWIKHLSTLSKLYFTPTFFGAEHIDASKPAMYVGNHTLYGVFDSPILIDYLFNYHKVAVVSIADHGHFYLPGWRTLFKKFGAMVIKNISVQRCNRVIRSWSFQAAVGKC